jgi:hypothetical protein
MCKTKRFTDLLRQIKQNSSFNKVFIKNIQKGDWVMITDEYRRSRYGYILEKKKFIDEIGNIVKVYNVYIPSTNANIMCLKQDLMIHIPLSFHNKLMRKIINRKICSDMINITNLVISIKTNQLITWC